LKYISISERNNPTRTVSKRIGRFCLEETVFVYQRADS